MNLEQIDTSTTAGKARVMQLADQGRRVAVFYRGEGWREALKPLWNWDEWDFAIIAELVGPKNMFVVLRGDDTAVAVCDTLDRANTWAGAGDRVIHYLRADLAGEVK